MIRETKVVLPRSVSVSWGLLMSMRPWQWTKNLLVFLPLAFSVGERWQISEFWLVSELAFRGIFAFLVLCALSGAVYIMNDLFDRESDRFHPRKQHRPIASGAVPASLAALASASLVAGATAGAAMMGMGMLLIAVIYLAINIGYTSFFKHAAVLDVMSLSGGFILRVVAGSMVIGVVTSPWLYTTVALGALFLSLGKRYSELRVAGQEAQGQRSVLGQYTLPLLNQLITIAATSTLLAYGLYTFSASNVPDSDLMMLTIPFVAFGLFRYLYILNTTDEGESPELVMVKDVPLITGIALWGLTSVIILALTR